MFLFDRVLRSAVVAVALSVVAGAAIADAQTVIMRKAPPGSTVEVMLNAAAAGSDIVDATGDAVVSVPLPAGKDETDANLFVDVCESVRRVLIVERGEPVPPRTEGCERHDMAGLFLVRRVSSLVFTAGGAAPTVLLRQGSYSLDPPRVWKPAPAGFVVFGGAGFASFRDASAIACGTFADCSGDDSGVLYSGGATYWFSPFLGAEVSYMKPGEAKASANIENFSFDSMFDAEVVTIAGKIGVPIGPTRLYGNIGTTYHRALSRTTQTAGEIVDTFEVQTKGWGWMWGGGFEAWLASSFALYGEGGVLRLKGKAVEPAEGELNERVMYAVGGIRLRFGG